MSFLFDFDKSDREVEPPPAVPALPAKRILPSECLVYQQTFVLADAVSTVGGTLYKRNVADVNFDIADNDNLDGENELAKAIVSQTDLIPGVYEGGLKTWECAIDLVNYLASLGERHFYGKHAIELGCGSSLPGLFLLNMGARVDFQDYNESVLKLVTVPNVLINLISKIRPPQVDGSGTCEIDLSGSRPEDFVGQLWSGDWDSLKHSLMGISEADKYDVIVTSETIYSSQSHSKLVDLMQAIVKSDGVIYLAAKNVYFGCSGSLSAFLSVVQEKGATEVSRVWELNDSVRREIVRIRF
ncbi:hypothetical protein DFS34DRAFT_329691 [Phlyctochytrium arcticum]|nr:hypothetical protein DFS34DRAFT_329691 [Phlyctochytrium arcticum]